MSVQLETLPDAQAGSKVIFISYSRTDEAWVDDYLRPLLSAAGLEYFVDKKDFPIGHPLDESICELLRDCHYALFVMTPDWVRGKCTHYESVRALGENGEVTARRILPIKLKDCDVPAHIANHRHLDIRKAKERDKEITHLLKQIGVSEEGIAKALNRVAKKTLSLLIELLEDPKVREKITQLREMFLLIQRSNGIFVCNKQLHDDLQRIQQSLTQLPLAHELFSPEEINWERILSSSLNLCGDIDHLLNRAAAVTDELVDVTFVDSFKGLPEALDGAVQECDNRRFSNHLAQLSRQLDRALPRINDRIVQHVKERPLAPLLDSLEWIYDEIAGGVDFDEGTNALLLEFKHGIEALLERNQSIQDHVDDHEILQEAEMEFQQMIRQGAPSFYDIDIHWQRVAGWIKVLKLQHRYEKLFNSYDQLCQRMNDDLSIRDDRFENAVVLDFVRFVHETRKTFNKLDIDLLGICKELTPHSNDLQKILDKMHRPEPRE